MFLAFHPLASLLGTYHKEIILNTEKSINTAIGTKEEKMRISTGEQLSRL